MAASKGEACIFCSANPCECNKKADKPKRRKPAVKHESPKLSSRFTASPVPRVAPPKPERTTQFKQSEPSAEAKTQEQLEFESAIRNLAPILRRIEVERYADIINPKHSSSIESRLIDWRKRHRGILRSDA